MTAFHGIPNVSSFEILEVHRQLPSRIREKQLCKSCEKDVLYRDDFHRAVNSHVDNVLRHESICIIR